MDIPIYKPQAVNHRAQPFVQTSEFLCSIPRVVTGDKVSNMRQELSRQQARDGTPRWSKLSDEQGNVLAEAVQAAEFSPDIKKERVGCFRPAKRYQEDALDTVPHLSKGQKHREPCQGVLPWAQGRGAGLIIWTWRREGTNSAASVQKTTPGAVGS